MSIGALICVLLSAAAAVVAFGQFRRKRLVRALRWVGWALVPLGIAMTGTAKLLGRITDAITAWATSFVWNPLTWAGIVVLGAAGGRLVATGVASARESGEGERAPGELERARPSTRSTSGLEGFEDVEELLRRRGVK